MLYQRVHTAPTPLTDVAPDVPSRLAELVMWALATEPTNDRRRRRRSRSALAERATDAFGSGWLARTGLRASVGSRIAALTETAKAVVMPSALGAPVRPERATRIVGPPPSSPSGLLPVAENAEGGRAEHLRELRLLLGRSTTTEAQRLAGEIERAESTAHELRELALLRRIRSGEVTLAPADRDEVERLIGGAGPNPIGAPRVGRATPAPTRCVPPPPRPSSGGSAGPSIR